MKASVLIIDDDCELCDLLGQFLALEGFDTTAVHDGIAAVAHCRQQQYDAVVLDIMLPGLPGLDVLRELRAFSMVPVIMLTARGEDTDRILGLELGADDYLPKPCNPRELAARLRAVLRRVGGVSDTSDQSIVVDGTRIEPTSRRASHNNIELDLTSTEFNILAILTSRAGNVVDKETISREAMGRSLSAFDRSVDVHVSKIRKKLAAAGGEDLIVSVRGIGYQFRTGGGSG